VATHAKYMQTYEFLLECCIVSNGIGKFNLGPRVR